MLFNEASYNHQEIFLSSNLKETDHLKILDVDVRIISQRSLKKYDRLWIGFFCLRPGIVAGSCEHGNEPVI
jgi:hypothetical protein